MTSQQILGADVLDILFEKRNKAYGAYLLRRRYPKELLKAVGITALLVLLLLFFGGSPQTEEALVQSDRGFETRDVNLPKEKLDPPKPRTPPPVQPVKQAVLLDVIKPVEKTTAQVATQQDLDDAQPGATKVDGPPATGLQPPPLPPANTGSGAETVIEKAEPPLPSRQPQFPGGTDAWLRFLSRNLVLPSDLEAGEKRSVLVRFSVDEEGVVTNFQVVQSGGSDFDNEVIRVLKKMPRWLPAIQNGKPAAVSFTQPVTFQGE